MSSMFEQGPPQKAPHKKTGKFFQHSNMPEIRGDTPSEINKSDSDD